MSKRGHFEWVERISNNFVEGHNITSLVKRAIAEGPRKQSSATMSTLAARLLKRLGDMPGQYMIRNQEEGIIVRAWEIRSLCASVLSQDETKGQTKRRLKNRKRMDGFKDWEAAVLGLPDVARVPAKRRKRAGKGKR